MASSGISLLEFLFRAGLTTTANWIAEWSSMQYKAGNSDVQNVPIAILSISYRVSERRHRWAGLCSALRRSGCIPHGCCWRL